MIYFSIVQFYILVLSFYLVAQALTPENLSFNLKDSIGTFLKQFVSSTGGVVLVALVSTYGIYFIASFLYWDPWHMFTSSWAYFLGMPSSINILMVYAFCNWHDVSWGTKGSDKADALPSAQTKQDAQVPFVEEVEKPQADIDVQFEQTVKRALAPWREPGEKDETTLEDSYKAFRTNLVLFWTFSNGLLALCINNDGIKKLCLTVCKSPLTEECELTLPDNLHPPHRMVLPSGSLGHLGAFYFQVPGSSVVPLQSGHFVLFFQTLKDVLPIARPFFSRASLNASLALLCLNRVPFSMQSITQVFIMKGTRC